MQILEEEEVVTTGTTDLAEVSSMPAASSGFSPKLPMTRVLVHSSLCIAPQKARRWGFPGGAVVENLPANAGDTG